MKKLMVGIFSLLLIVSLIIGFWLFQEKELDLFGEVKIESPIRSTRGMFWKVIRSEKGRRHYEAELNITIPETNFDEFFLLLSDGRKIESITYQNISKYRHWKGLIGVETFGKTHYPNHVFIYKIEKLLLSQEGD